MARKRNCLSFCVIVCVVYLKWKYGVVDVRSFVYPLLPLVLKCPLLYLENQTY